MFDLLEKLLKILTEIKFKTGKKLISGRSGHRSTGKRQIQGENCVIIVIQLPYM